MTVLDAARFVVAGLGVILAAHQVALALSDAGVGWRGHLGTAVALLILCGSRLENLGHPATWQFVGTTVVVALIGWSSYRRLRRDQLERADP